jgi:hypothetical protein
MNPAPKTATWTIVLSPVSAIGYIGVR